MKQSGLAAVRCPDGRLQGHTPHPNRRSNCRMEARSLSLSMAGNNLRGSNYAQVRRPVARGPRACFSLSLIADC